VVTVTEGGPVRSWCNRKEGGRPPVCENVSPLCLCPHLCLCMHLYVCVSVCIHAPVCVSTYVCACMYVHCVYVSVCPCVCPHACRCPHFLPCLSCVLHVCMNTCKLSYWEAAI
jgi:hypothetical protein